MQEGKLTAEQRRNAPYCILPWVHFYGAANGRIYPCCFSSDTSDNEFDFSRPLISNQEPFDFKSANFENLRQAFLTGNPPSFCESCTSLEKYGGISRRIEAQTQFEDLYAALLKGENVSVGGVRHAQFSIGNVCNLKCRMCNPFSSSKLVSEWTEMGWLSNFVPPSDVYESDEFWEQFFLRNPNLRNLVLAGGETLLTPRILKIIDQAVESGIAKNLELEIHSNFTHLTEDILEKFQQFRRVKMMASIDGFREVNSYIRYPSNWNDIEENLRKFHALCSNTKFRLSINATVQAYNTLGLVDLIQFILSFNYLSTCKLNLLRQPEELQVKVLPINVRKVASRKIRDFLDSKIVYPAIWNDEKQREFSANLMALIHHLEDSGDPNDNRELRNSFIYRTQEVDRLRRQGISKYIPELVELLPELGFKSSLPEAALPGVRQEF